MRLTFKLRLRDKHVAELNRQARAVNFVWNYCNETQRKAANDRRQWLTGFDLWKLVAGCTKEGLGLHSHSAMRVCLQYDKARRKSLGWVPFNTGHVSFDGETFKFRGVKYETMHLRDIPIGAEIGAGSFNQDTRGRWYINCPVDAITADSAASARVGIDLGLKDFATLSTGEKIEIPQFYRKSEAALADAQRRRKGKRAKAIAAKVANRRRDFLHKTSAKIAKGYGLIFIGDVSPSKLAKTNMAKSVLDAGWSDFRRMLSYKAIRHGGSMLEVSENYTSQTCSSCGTLPMSRPRGIAGLAKRVWSCSDCGTVHDRDANAAQNILRIGLDTLVAGTPNEGGSKGAKAPRNSVLQGGE